MKRLGLILLLILQMQIIFAQQPTAQDCLGAIPICETKYTEPSPYQYSGEGNYLGEIQDINVCIPEENNGVWYIFTAESNGVFKFHIIPNNNEDDYDWAVFNLTDATCGDISSATEDFIVSSNTWGEQTGEVQGATGADSDMITTGVYETCNGNGTDNGPKWNPDILVFRGQTYVLYVSNWTGSEDGYEVDFSKSTAAIYDQTPPALKAMGQTMYPCGTNQLWLQLSERVPSSKINLSTFLLTGPNGTVNINEIDGESYGNQGEYERDFSLNFDSGLTPGNYTLSIKNSFTDACGNVVDNGSLTFVIAPLERPTTLANDPLCHNGFGTLVVTADTSLISVEYSSDGGASYVSNSGNFANLPADTYSLVVRNPYNCTSAPISITIQAPDKLLPLTQVTNITTCYGRKEGSIMLTAVGGMGAYYFSINNGSDFSEEPLFTALFANDYEVLVKDENDCISDLLTVTITEPEKVELQTSVKDITCYGLNNGSIVLTASGGMGNYRYSLNDIVTETGIYTNLQANEYTPFVTDKNNCSSIGGDLSVLEPAALRYLNYWLAHIPCHNMDLGGSIGTQITGGTGEPILVIDGIQYANTLVSGLHAGNYYMYLTDANNCISEENYELEIEVLPCLKIPGAITPNSDGYNDYWFIEQAEFYPNISVKLYDRFGRLIFETGQYFEPWYGKWNGTLLPTDTYFYVINYNDGTKPITGPLLLVR